MGVYIFVFLSVFTKKRIVGAADAIVVNGSSIASDGLNLHFLRWSLQVR